MTSTSLDRFRIAMKFSLWAWFFYWPGGGLLLLWGGLDLASILVTLGSLAAFVLVLRAGALDSTSSRNIKEFLLERPLYLVLAFVLVIIGGALFSPLENVGLGLFATLYLGGLVFLGVRLVEHLRETDQPVFKSGADQMFILLALTGFAAFLVAVDALLAAFSTSLPAVPSTVAVFNWLNLVYPPLLLVASRPFREPLRNPFQRTPDDDGSAPAAEATLDAN